MSMLQCILTALGTIVALYAIKRIHQYIWIDRVDRWDYDRAQDRAQEQQRLFHESRDLAWKERGEAVNKAAEANERAERAERMLVTQTERIHEALKSMTGSVRARTELILNGQTPKL